MRAGYMFSEMDQKSDHEFDRQTQEHIGLGLNGVVVGRHGLILKDNEAMGSRKVSGYLWDSI